MKISTPSITAFIICTIAISKVDVECQFAEAKSATAAQQFVAAFKHKWVTISGKEVDVEIVRQNEDAYIVKFSRKGQAIELVSSPPPDLGSYPKQLFSLDDGNLATIWTSGGPYLIMTVFKYEGGKVFPVLRTSSKVLPEFVFGGAGVVAGDKTEHHLPSQTIVISNADWVSSNKSQGSKLMPVKADLYWWDKSRGKYRSKLGVSWKSRLNRLMP